jgi:hypothetical protein
MGQTPQIVAIGPHAEARRLVGRLQSLYDADRAVLDLIALGPAAVPPLRDFVFRREPSGLYQPRVQAVSALAALKADDELIAFLRRVPEVEIVDPIERTGEDAVINAAARALAHRRDDEFFTVLTAIAERRRLAGVVEALGATGRSAAIPYLVDALESDFTRPVAEAALRNVGAAARPAIMRLALTPQPCAEFETPSSLRNRRSAVGVLRDIGLDPADWPQLRNLLQVRDPWLAALAANLALATRLPRAEHKAAAQRLLALLQSADWLLAEEIESWLAQRYQLVQCVIAGAVADADGDDRIRQSLARILARQSPARSLSKAHRELDSS